VESSSFNVDGFLSDNIVAFDVTDPQKPVRLDGVQINAAGSIYRARFDHQNIGKRRYYVAEASGWHKPQILLDQPSDLHNTSQGADYIIITHPSFYTDVLPLAAFRAGQGMRVSVVNVHDIYDEFGYGLLDPESIRSFLAYAYAYWQPPAPAYVLLAGDGHYDPLDYLGHHELEYIPPYLDHIDLWIGETFSDNHYALVSGDDKLPDLYIGRLPVKTREETAALVSKLINYETTPVLDGWNQRVMFISDNSDDGGDFYGYSDIIVDNYLPAPYVSDKIYYRSPDPVVSYQRAITSGINDGRLIVSYVGHGMLSQWASERLLWAEKLYTLDNANKLPFVVPMTCMEGYIIHPFYPRYPTTNLSAISERMLRLPTTGSIASFSPGGWGLAAGHDYLERGLFSAIFNDYVAQLGPATTQAKLYLYAQTGGAYTDLIETYALLGDPATTLPLFRPDVALSMSATGPDYTNPYSPAITYTVNYTNTGQGMATHVSISDLLPGWARSSRVTATGPAITARPGAPYVWDVADIAPGGSGQIVMRVDIDPLYRGKFANQASISSAGEVDAQDNNQAGVVLPNPYYPELALTQKALALDLSNPNDLRVVYVLDYENRGTLLAMNVVITDVIPAWAISSSYVYSGPQVTARAGAPYIWDVADMPPGVSGRITLTLGVDREYMQLYVNEASISAAAELGSLDDNRAVGIARNPYYPDADLVKTALPPDFSDPLAPRFTYRLDYSNHSLVWANQVVITDVLPTWALTSTYTYTGPALTLRPGSRYIWDVADLPPGASGRITITIQADLAYPLPFINMASASAFGEYGPQENNFAQAWTRVFHFFYPLMGRPLMGRR